MKIDILAGGSSGNAIAIKSGDAAILIDCGIAKTKIEKRLLEVGIKPNEIKAILITHAHSDHVKGLPIANKYKIPVFAAENEWKSIKGVDEELRWSFSSGNDFNVEDFFIESFKTHHDAFDPVGYAITDYESNEKVSICLDTGKVDEAMMKVMEHSTYYIIESNHEPNMVEVSDYPNSVKARILSHIGHLSNEQTSKALSGLVDHHTKKIYLTHLSSKNNMPALAEMTVKRELSKYGLICDLNYKLEVIS
ncbi:MBL fold metallo-hydrolase [Metabacillus halosaccharovorans]|uniref:MBL fold metallo-hydrolase n=1 Tax=Metabacillus halosaccharovorans TaxID=930124 RepID=UPI0009956968|nr:MBL fold metallo-hydrolase [Metabacillus halosaccharovorans]